MKDKSKRYTDADVIKELERRIAEGGGLRPFARFSGLSPTFISMVRHKQTPVSVTIAAHLGFMDDGKRWVRKRCMTF